MKQRLLLFFLFFTTLASFLGQAQTTPDCVSGAELKFRLLLEETTGTQARDVSGNGNSGTVHGGVWQSTNSTRPHSLLLEGNDGLYVPFVCQPTTFTVAFWVKPTHLSNYNCIIAARLATYSGSPWGGFVFHTSENGSIAAGIDLGSSIIYMAPGTLTVGEWQQFVFTYDNGTGTLYRNGKLLGSQTGMPMPRTWEGLMVGVSDFDSTLGYGGNISDLRLYLRTLSAQEASTLAQCPPQTPVSALTCSLPSVQASPSTSITAGQAATLQVKAKQTALRFDGVADQVIVGNSGTATSLVPSNVVNTFTVEAWVNPTATHEIDQQQVNGYEGVYNQRYLIHPTYGGNWGEGHVGMGISVGTNGVSVYEHATSYMPPLLVWQGAVTGWTHLAVVYQNRRPTLYINGNLVATGEQSPKAYVHPSLNLGGDVYGYFQGQADEIRIWNEARTKDQIQSNYRQVLTTSFPTLVSCWHLDEGSGLTIQDASGYTLVGTLTRGNVVDASRNVVAPPPGPGPQWVNANLAPLASDLTYTWSPSLSLDRTRGSSVVASPAKTTTYTVAGTNDAGCTTDPATVTVTVKGAVDLPPSNPSENRERNWTLERSFDGEGNVVAESKQFTDGLGRPTQAQARNAATRQVFAAQTIYSTGGQPVLQTLAAPTNNQSFNYKEDFVTATVNGQSAAYGPANFEQGNASNPTPVEAATIGTLGYYYSKQNDQEPLTPITSYPYSLVEPYDGPLGGTRRAAGPGDELRMGKGREAKGRDFPVRKEFDQYLALRPAFVPGSAPTTLEYQAVKSVSVNADGRESFVVSNKDGQALVSGLSGAQYPGLPVAGYLSAEYAHPVDPDAPAYVDVHIPAAGPQAVSFAGVGSVPSSVRVSDLLSEASYDYPVTASSSVAPVAGSYAYTRTSGTAITVTLAPGFYRFAALSGTQLAAYEAHYGNFSYTYYDDAGRVVATVAPNGLTDAAAVAADTAANPPPFTTRNTYDTTGRLLATESADEGRSEYVYAKDGRIRFSQSALQRPAGRFSYSNYDEVGRVVESGEYTPGNLVFQNHLTSAPAATSVLQTSLLEERLPTNSLDPARCAQRNQVWYDLAFDGTPGSQGNDTQLSGRHQEFVVGAVAKTQNEHVTTWYSYDELGRVTWVVQDVKGVGVKTLDYQYDFSGNVLQVAYQKGQPDSFYHYYGYDAAQRLTTVHTSPDGEARTRQAEYSYYLHGPLKRVQVAGDLQGVDYVYTLQGALKSINHANQTLEPGHDAPATNGVYKDLFALTLEYFSGDYASRALDVPAPPVPGAPVAARYDGTIRSASWRTAASPDVQRLAYTYDEKSQLQNSTYSNWQLINQAYQLNAGSTSSFQEGNLKYDPNGNMLSLRRTDQQGAVTDNFSYDYKANTNQLQAVHTAGAPTGTAPVLDYDYDALGQLVRQRDEQGQRYLTYDVTGKTTGIYLDAAHTRPLVQYAYDDRGFRVRQTVYPANGAPAHVTTYVRDVAGNLLALYEQATPTSPAQRSEVPLYGASRLGVLAHLSDGTATGTDDYRYELNDHLGNARVVFHRPPTRVQVETMELGGVPAAAAFLNADRYRVPVRGAPSGDYVARLTDSQPAGQELKRVLRVSRGDTITFSALGQWKQNAAAGSGATPYVLLGAAAGLNGLSQHGAEGQTTAYPTTQSNWLSLLAAGLGFTLGQGAPASLGATSLEGWLKYRVLDTQGNPMRDAQGQELKGVDYLRGTGQWEYLQTGVRLPQDGTLEVTAGTSGTGEAVYFDNLRVEQTGGLIVQEQHQYAFGAPLPGLSYRVGNRRYRYGYQGQFAERDSLTGFESFELRLYSSRVGRWLSYDPEGIHSSPYLAMANDPVSITDPTGGVPGGNFFQRILASVGIGSVSSNGYRLGSVSLGGALTKVAPVAVQAGAAALRANEIGSIPPYRKGTSYGPLMPTLVVPIHNPINYSSASDGSPIAAALPLAATLAVGDGPLPIGDVIGGVILAGATAYEISQRIYITYRLTDGKRWYLGRTSGFGDPQSIMMRRYARHNVLQSLGFGPPTLDRAVQGILGYPAMRGREQQLIDYYGGVGNRNVANSIRGVGKTNPAGRFYYQQSNLFFGPLAGYTGN